MHRSVRALPLDKSLVLATNRKHALRVGGEGSTHDVLAMPRVALLGVGVVDRGVAVDVDEAPVIARNNELAIWGNLHLVDVSAILTGRVHTLHIPAKLARSGSP